jgi:hypothetical protein
LSRQRRARSLFASFLLFHVELVLPLFTLLISHYSRLRIALSQSSSCSSPQWKTRPLFLLDSWDPTISTRKP